MRKKSATSLFKLIISSHPQKPFVFWLGIKIILQARTGYPFIDAIMTQLKREGWIHHLARHAVACFLTRGDLWISWEEGLKVVSYKISFVYYYYCVLNKFGRIFHSQIRKWFEPRSNIQYLDCERSSGWLESVTDVSTTCREAIFRVKG